MIALVPHVEMDFGAGWVDVSGDVTTAVRAEWGVRGGGPSDRVAAPGTMTFALDNSSGNSGGVRGYYSPGHDDARAGFGIGTPVRLVISHPLFGNRVKWVGTIDSAVPQPGAKAPITSVLCVDWMEEAAKAKLSGLEVQTDIQSDALFEMLVGAVERQPPGGTLVGTGSDVYPFALDNVQDESSRVLGELQKLAKSEYGLAYVSAGVAVFEGRRRRGGAGSIRFAMHEDEEILGLGVSHGRDSVINRVQVTIHPRRRDAAATSVLFNLGSAVQIQRKTEVVLKCPYRDPNQQAQRVGGLDMVAPVATTDYLFNSAQDGSGGDLTLQLAVSATFGGNAAVVTVTNNGPADGYLTKLQLRGRGLYDFEPVISDRRDDDSAAAYGENSESYDMPYQSSPSNAVDLAQFLLALGKDPKTRVETVTFIANWSDEVAEQALFLEISDRISITSPTLGLAGVPYFVNGVQMDVQPSGRVSVTWYLAPVDTSEFWVLEVDGRTELDETTILGYGLFAVGWILGESELGTDTFLN